MNGAPCECPDCDGHHLRLVWELPMGAGLFSEHSTLAGPATLWECRDCALSFRHPCPDQAFLTSIYETVPETTWSTQTARHAWQPILDAIIRLAPTASIMDIGCFTGDFLAQFPTRFLRFGVEPNAGARKIATSKGVSILGRSFDEVQDFEKVGAVTLLDVMEHVQSPFKLLAEASAKAVEGGIVVVLSGNARSWPWRLVGRTYWYSAVPGHVRFLNPTWARRAAAKLGLELVQVRTISSDWQGWQVFARQGAQALAFAIVDASRHFGHAIPRIVETLPGFRKAARWQSPPWWSTAPDHAIFVFRVRARGGT